MKIENLCKTYYLHDGNTLKAVNDVSLTIAKGETLGLIGESGCGKSTLLRCLLLLEKMDTGNLIFEDNNMSDLKKNELFLFRRKAQMIFQNAYGSLNSKMTVGQNIAEPLHIHHIFENHLINKHVYDLLDAVGINKNMFSSYPRELSGGQRQRVAIARALALKPLLLVCDEPTSSLDLSIQMQILTLLKDLQKEYHLTYLFVSHDLDVIRLMADRVAVMQAGRISRVLVK